MELVFCFYMGKKRNAQDTHPMSMQRGGRVGVVRESPPFDHTIHRKGEEKVEQAMFLLPLPHARHRKHGVRVFERWLNSAPSSKRAQLTPAQIRYQVRERRSFIHTNFHNHLYCLLHRFTVPPIPYFFFLYNYHKMLM